MVRVTGPGRCLGERLTGPFYSSTWRPTQRPSPSCLQGNSGHVLGKSEQSPAAAPDQRGQSRGRQQRGKGGRGGEARGEDSGSTEMTMFPIILYRKRINSRSVNLLPCCGKAGYQEPELCGSLLPKTLNLETFLWNAGFPTSLRGNRQLYLGEPLLPPYWLPFSTHSNLNH